jgi:protein-disulfide isomerase
LDRLLKEYPGRIKIVTYQVTFSNVSVKASEAALCAGEQGKYWEYHDKLFENQRRWSNASDAGAYFEKYGREVGLDLGKFDSCLDSDRAIEQIKKDDMVRLSRNVNSTPTIFIGDKRIVGAQSFFVYKRVIDGLLQSR